MDLPKAPFEDGIFISLYRFILLRNVEFCEVISKQDRAVCVSMTTKFVHKAINDAYAIDLSLINHIELINKSNQYYDIDKNYYYLYIIYRELLRRKNKKAKYFLKAVKASSFKDSSVAIFLSFNHKIAWDFLLTFLAQQDLNKEIFSLMWNRYSSSLLNVSCEKYTEFVFKNYLKEVADPTKLDDVSVANNCNYIEIIEIAEKSYFDPEIFK